jgi:hypothetical protein
MSILNSLKGKMVYARLTPGIYDARIKTIADAKNDKGNDVLAVTFELVDRPGDIYNYTVTPNGKFDVVKDFAQAILDGSGLPLASQEDALYELYKTAVIKVTYYEYTKSEVTGEKAKGWDVGAKPWKLAAPITPATTTIRA